jgi:hypothetical protein
VCRRRECRIPSQASDGDDSLSMLGYAVVSGVDLAKMNAIADIDEWS